MQRSRKVSFNPSRLIETGGYIIRIAQKLPGYAGNCLKQPITRKLCGKWRLAWQKPIFLLSNEITFQVWETQMSEKILNFQLRLVLLN